VGAFRAIEAYDPAINSWMTLPPMPMPRHGVAGAVIGDRFYLASGMIQSAGALAMQDPKLQVDTSSVDILDLSMVFGKSDGAKSEAANSQARASDRGERKTYTRYDIKS